MDKFSIFTNNTKKSLYLNTNDLEKKTNVLTVIYKYEILYTFSGSTSILYVNDFFVNGVEYK